MAREVAEAARQSQVAQATRQDRAQRRSEAVLDFCDALTGFTRGLFG